MAISNMLTGFSRLSLNTIRQSVIRGISTTNNDSPLYFRATGILFGEPLKKKKRLDPAIIRHREDRKRRKLEKYIRQLEKHTRQLRPIEEIEIPVKLIDERKMRIRKKVELSADILENRALMEKKWSQYKQCEYSRDVEIINTVLLSQKKALNELRAESEILYQAAIQIDVPSLLPHMSSGPAAVTDTPPVLNYDSPDGSYTNITMKFDGDIETN